MQDTRTYSTTVANATCSQTTTSTNALATTNCNTPQLMQPLCGPNVLPNRHGNKHPCGYELQHAPADLTTVRPRRVPKQPLHHPPLRPRNAKSQPVQPLCGHSSLPSNHFNKHPRDQELQHVQLIRPHCDTNLLPSNQLPTLATRPR